MISKINIEDVIYNEDSKNRCDEYLISNIFLYSLKNKLINNPSDYELIKYAENITRFDDFKNTSKLYEYLSNLNKEEIKELLKEVIKGKVSSIKYQNTCINDSLNELCIRLLNIVSMDSIFNVGTGLSNFIYDLYDYSKNNNIDLKDIKGIDLDKNKVSLGEMVLSILLDDNKSPYSLINVDAFDKLEINSSKGVCFLLDRYDSLKSERVIDSNYKDIKFSFRNSVEWIALDKVLSNKSIERFIALVPSRILYSENDKEYRNKVISEGLIESIIELPSNLIKDIPFKVCLIVFSKNNSSIKLLDINSLSDESSKDSDVLDINKIMDLYSSSDIKSISNEDALNVNNLIPSTILIKLNNNFEGIKLSEVAKVINGSQYTLRNFEKYLRNEETHTKLLTLSDIDSFNINFETLKNVEINDSKYDKFLLEEGDLVITSKSSKVKLAVVDIPLKDKIIVTGGMIVIRPTKNKLDSMFLKMYLDSSLGQLAIKSIQKGETIVSIYPKDINELIIPKVDITTQKELSSRYKEKLSKLKEYKKEIKELESQLVSFYDLNK